MSEQQTLEPQLAALRRGIHDSERLLRAHPGDALSVLCTRLLLNGGDAERSVLDRLTAGGRPLLRIREQLDLAATATNIIKEPVGEPLVTLAIVPATGALFAGSASGALYHRGSEKETLSQLAWLPAGIVAIHPSPSDSGIVVMCEDSSVHLLDREGGVIHSQSSEQGGGATACAWLNDSLGYVLGYQDGRISIVSPAGEIETKELYGHAGAVRVCMTLADGRTLLSGSDDCSLRLWDLDSGRCHRRLIGHRAAITACDCRERAGRLLSADVSGGLRLWDCDGADLGHLPGHDAAITGCLLSREGVQAISVSRDGTLRRWDCAEQTELTRLRVHDGEVLGLLPLAGDFDLDRTSAGSGGVDRVVTWGDDDTVAVWDLANGGEIPGYRLRRGALLAVAALSEERVLVSTSDGNLETIEPTGLSAPEITGRSRAWPSFAVNEDEEFGIALHRGGAVEWQQSASADGYSVSPLGNTHESLFCAYIRSRNHFLTLDAGGVLTAWGYDRAQASLTRILSGTSMNIALRGRNPSAFVVAEFAERVIVNVGFDNGELIAVVLSDEGEVTEQWESLPHPSAVTAVCVDPVGTLLLSGHQDGTCVLIDYTSAYRITRFKDHSQAVTASAALPHGQEFLTGCADGVLRRWRAGSETAVQEMAGHSGAIHACTTDPDGRLAITTGEDETLKIWSLDNGQCIETFHGNAAFTGLYLSANGAKLWALDCEGWLQVFDMASF